MSWRPGRRKRQRALEKPFEGVPRHLQSALFGWLVTEVGRADVRAREDFTVGMHWAIEHPTPAGGDGGREWLAAVGQQFTDDGVFLDAIEWWLDRRGRAPYPVEADRTPGGGMSAQLPAGLLPQVVSTWSDQRFCDTRRLDELLAEGNSLYRVRADGRGLEERIAPEVTEQFEQTVAAADETAAGHLVTAWNHAYGRSPDATRSYDESIKAVERAYAPIVSPNNRKAVLTSIRGDIRNKPSKWVFVLDGGDQPIDGVSAVQDMMRLLEASQPDRHSTGAYRPATLVEARAAVHLAGALVQFVVGGAFTTASAAGG